MNIRVWRLGVLSNSNLEELNVSSMDKLWFDVSDPSVEDMEALAEALKIPRSALMGKLNSNYSHIDSYPEYTKVFVWYLNTSGSGRDITSDMGPIVVFTNGQSVVSISKSWTRLSNDIELVYDSLRYSSISHTARVIYLALNHVLKSYEYFVDIFESQAEKLEDQTPPWPRSDYMNAFIIRREASSLLRQLRHLKRLTEDLTDNHTELGIKEAEKRLFDIIYERVIGAEETTEKTHEVMQDLIGIHMDTLSIDMNKTIRLIAALTVIIGVPSLFSTLIGINLTSQASGAFPWEIALSSLAMLFLGLFFYKKGWLRLD